jgi:chemotaxis methyl-accepting protein methylase
MSRKDRLDRKHTGITTVKENKNTTTGNRMPLRLTLQESENLDELVDLVKELIPNKQVNRSRILRALTYINNEQQIKKIAKSIMENT